MRVITGTAKGKKLKEVPGDTTRPITDRTKEALFSILGTWVIDMTMLDLFGGTGAVGIEALSRGAAHVTFIDKAGPACKTIAANLGHTNLSERATVRRGDAFKFLTEPDRLPQSPLDLIYIAPPQYHQLWEKALLLVDANPTLLKPDGIAIVQIHPREYRDLPLQNLIQYDERKYGSTLLCFYERADRPAEPET